MRAVVVVVPNVLCHETLEMTLVESDDVVEEITPTASDEPLGDAILPWTAEVGPLRFDPKAFDGRDDFCVEVAPAVEDQILRGRVIRKRLASLLRDPFAGRLPGDSEVQHPALVMGDHKEAVHHAER